MLFSIKQQSLSIFFRNKMCSHHEIHLMAKERQDNAQQPKTSICSSMAEHSIASRAIWVQLPADAFTFRGNIQRLRSMTDAMTQPFHNRFHH
jgi:hypothetical protein